MVSSKLLLRGLIGTATLLASPLLLAGFSTYSKDWPDDACVVDEKISNPQTKPCDPNPKPLDIKLPAKNTRLDEYKRLYANLSATFLTAQIRDISNTSLPALSGGTVVTTSLSDNYMSWEFGLGTKLEYLRLELDYLYEKHMQYDVNPLFNGSNENLSSELNSQSIWFNMMYDMPKLNIPYFTPYFGGLVGVVWNKTRSTLTGTIGTGAAQNHSRYAIGWGVTAGVRMPFWTRWFGYLGYKYLDHGKVVWQDSTGIMSLKGQYIVQGVELGVHYLLG